MNTGSKVILVASLGFTLAQLAIGAESKPALTNELQKASYSLGMMYAFQFKNNGVEIDPDILAGAIKDVQSGAELPMTTQQAQDTLRAYQISIQAKLAEKNRALGEKNLKEGEAFLAENKKKEGIKTFQVPLPDGKMAELQYKVIAEGTGNMPKSNDVVAVNYRGTLIDGQEFDSSAKQGKPVKFAANRVIRGWTEALQRMKTGAKWQVFIPSTLAYGEPGHPPAISPNATLIFEIELVSFEAPAPAVLVPQPQPLTSDIVKVPSAEERKKGAQPEIIKAEDAAKQIEAARKAEQDAQKKQP